MEYAITVLSCTEITQVIETGALAAVKMLAGTGPSNLAQPKTSTDISRWFSVRRNLIVIRIDSVCGHVMFWAQNGYIGNPQHKQTALPSKWDM